MSYKKTEKTVAEDKSSQLKALGKRICYVADLYENRKSAADTAHISTDQLSRYIRGENQPGLLAMAALAKPFGISLDWLATGDGDKSGKGVNTDLLTLILETIAQALDQHQIQLSIDKKCRLVALLYSLYEQGSHESIKMDNVVRLIDYGK